MKKEWNDGVGWHQKRVRMRKMGGISEKKNRSLSVIFNDRRTVQQVKKKSAGQIFHTGNKVSTSFLAGKKIERVCVCVCVRERG